MVVWGLGSWIGLLVVVPGDCQGKYLQTCRAATPQTTTTFFLLFVGVGSLRAWQSCMLASEYTCGQSVPSNPWLLGLGFSTDGIGGLWCEAVWGFWGLGSLYKQKNSPGTLREYMLKQL